MKKKKKIKTINITIIVILLILIVSLIISIRFNIKNHNKINELETSLEELNINYTKLDGERLKLQNYKDKVEEKYGSVLLLNIDEISLRELREKMGKETFILVITLKSCSHCELYLPKLDAVLIEKNLRAYNLDVAKLSANDYETLKSLVEFNGTPTTVIFKFATDQKYYLEGDKSIERIRSFIEEKYYENE